MWVRENWFDRAHRILCYIVLIGLFNISFDMICHIALTMDTEVDVVAEVGDGEVVVEILDDGDVVGCTPCYYLVTLVVVFAYCKFGLLGMEIDYHGDMSAVAHLLQLVESGIEGFAVLADA